MAHIKLFSVEPTVPEELSFLDELARNMWWCWHNDAAELFRRIDPPLWNKCGKNPLLFLNNVPQNRFEELAEDEAFLAQLSEVQEEFRSEICHGTEDVCTHGNREVAYFCLEYGIHESIRLYSGGLGVLAGDHLKAASDVNASFLGVGLLYRQGYFRQYLNQDGWQQEHYPENDVHTLPLWRVRGDNGDQITVNVPLPEGQLKAVVWVLWVGNTPLYLLDTNIPENGPHYRGITARLYGGDHQMRLRQELLLAIGGFRALVAMGYDPAVCHMNEGHAAFLTLARLEYLMKNKGFSQETAQEIVRRSNVFTTHTPVAAGNERFHVDLVTPYLQALAEEIDIDPSQVLKWGMPQGTEDKEICNTILALRMSYLSNGVSQLHGEVARNMWAHLWKERPTDEVPIGVVTNAVHAGSWAGEELQSLFDRYLGPSWRQDPQEAAEAVDNIPDEELWRVHEFARTRLVRAARERMETQYRARNATESEIQRAANVLQSDILTIGFARRFATYKRATLLLRESERLKKLLRDDDQPIQLMFAGKAHPADDDGKALIRELIDFARQEGIRDRLVFLEDYDIALARQMVQGVDVWLNTPRRPLEASGTSGMKACLNGALHVSVLDGWWAEAYAQEFGWAVGDGEVFDDTEYQDMVETQALYNVLENEVIPAFYSRDTDSLPKEWLKKSKASIRNILKHYTTHRMFDEYRQSYYEVAQKAYKELTADSGRKAQELVEQRRRLEEHWDEIIVYEPEADRDVSMVKAGESFEVTVNVWLGELTPQEVDVQVYHGPVNSYQQIVESHCETMERPGKLKSGIYTYRQRLCCEQTGRFGFTCRVVPAGKDWYKDMPGFVTWA